MKKNFLWLLLAILPLFAGCSNDENGNSETGVDDLAYMLNRLAPTSDGKVYGVLIDERTPDIIGRPVKTVAEAQDEFYKLIPNGKDNKGIVKEEGGLMTYQLTRHTIPVFGKEFGEVLQIVIVDLCLLLDKLF